MNQVLSTGTRRLFITTISGGGNCIRERERERIMRNMEKRRKSSKSKMKKGEQRREVREYKYIAEAKKEKN